MEIKFKNKLKIVAEFKPTVRTVYTKYDFIRLSIPYQIWKFDGFLYLYFRDKPLEKEGDTLCYPYLPNIGDHCTVCLGIGFPSYFYRQSIVEYLERAISYFWQSSFNNDLDHCIIEYSDDPWHWLVSEQERKLRKYGIVHEWNDYNFSVKAEK